MLKCPECDVLNTADSNYCRRCGAHLLDYDKRPFSDQGHEESESQRPDDGLTAPVARDGAFLQFRSPIDREGELFALEGELVTIGRNPASHFFLDDVTVSRRHAHIVPDTRGYTIEDQGSLNGTYLNRRRIEKQQMFDGDEIQIGKFRLAFLDQKSLE